MECNLGEVRYPEAQTEDIRRCQAAMEHSTAWALTRNDAAWGLPLDLPYALRLLVWPVGMLDYETMICLVVI